MVCLSKPYQFKFFKGCFPQILLGPFLNTLTYVYVTSNDIFYLGLTNFMAQASFYTPSAGKLFFVS